MHPVETSQTRGSKQLAEAAVREAAPIMALTNTRLAAELTGAHIQSQIVLPEYPHLSKMHDRRLPGMHIHDTLSRLVSQHNRHLLLEVPAVDLDSRAHSCMLLAGSILNLQGESAVRVAARHQFLDESSARSLTEELAHSARHLGPSGHMCTSHSLVEPVALKKRHQPLPILCLKGGTAVVGTVVDFDKEFYPCRLGGQILPSGYMTGLIQGRDPLVAHASQGSVQLHNHISHANSAYPGIRGLGGTKWIGMLDGTGVVQGDNIIFSTGGKGTETGFSMCAIRHGIKDYDLRETMQACPKQGSGAQKGCV